MAGPVVLLRTVSTARSTVSAARTGQSPPRTPPARPSPSARGAGAGRLVRTSLMAPILCRPTPAAGCSGGGGRAAQPGRSKAGVQLATSTPTRWRCPLGPVAARTSSVRPATTAVPITGPTGAPHAGLPEAAAPATGAVGLAGAVGLSGAVV